MRCAAKLCLISGCAFVVAHLASSSARAAVLANYPFTGGTAASNDSDASTAGDFTINASQTGAGISATSNNLFLRSNTTAATEAAAADTPTTGTGTSYVGFTITPFAGFPLSLQTLTFQTIFNAATAGGATATANFVVRSSRDSFAADISPVFSETYQDVTGATGTFTGRSVDLSGAAFQNLSTTTEFRIYVFDNSTNNNQTPRLDTVQLTGTPEPASVALFGIGAMGLLTRRRRTLA
jgi:hypothetical protein